MSSQPGQLDDEQAYLRRCQQGDAEALGRLREIHHAALSNILLARGASRTETDDILADLWADCVPGDTERPALLEKFSGKCGLLGWLATVATRRWIDLKRRQSKVVTPAAATDDDSTIEDYAEPPRPADDSALTGLLRTSLQAAFASCPAQSMVLLRLRYLHNVSQRELVRMLGWHESKVSRALSQAMKEIETRTLAEIKKHDPLLRLTWDDFLELCRTQQIGFL